MAYRVYIYKGLRSNYIKLEYISSVFSDSYFISKMDNITKDQHSIKAIKSNLVSNIDVFIGGALTNNIDGYMQLL